MKRILAIITVFTAIAAAGAAPAAADEFGCKVLLCVSNPGGPRQFAECEPIINSLENMLKDHKPWPTCEEASSSYGYEPYYSCEEAYGSDYHDYSGKCRKKLAVVDWTGGGGGFPKMYDYKPRRWREDPYYVDIEGAPERHYFSLFGRTAPPIGAVP